MTGRTISEDGRSSSTRCSCGIWIIRGRGHTCRPPQVQSVDLPTFQLCLQRRGPALSTVSQLTLSLSLAQADWAHLSSDVLSAIVLKDSVDTYKQMHRVCRQWNTSVRCNMHTMQPKVLNTEQIKLYFPAIRHLHVSKIAFKQNSTLCLATLRNLQTLSLQTCAFDKCESIAELAALTGKTLLCLLTSHLQTAGFLHPTSFQGSQAKFCFLICIKAGF